MVENTVKIKENCFIKGSAKLFPRNAIYLISLRKSFKRFKTIKWRILENR